MKKTKTSYYCTACGNETPQWYGKCPACGAWGTVEEHVQAAAPAPGRAAAASREPKKLSQVMGGDEIRFSTGIGELDRVLGGGAVLGSLVLISGLIMFALSLYYSFLFSSVMETEANVLPALVSLLGTAIVFFSGVSTSQGMLFGFKDYDMLMAMPLTEKDIVTSKITVYTITQYFYTVLLVIPAMRRMTANHAYTYI